MDRRADSTLATIGPGSGHRCAAGRLGKIADYQLAVERHCALGRKLTGEFPAATIVLIRSGWGKFWGDRKRYFGTDDAGRRRQSPFSRAVERGSRISRQTAAYQSRRHRHAEHRSRTVEGFSRASNTSARPIVPIFENVASLDRLPAKGATIFAIPMKIKGGSGAPLRIFAILP